MDTVSASDDAWIRLALQALTADDIARAEVFLFVAARLAGFFGIGAMLGRAILSWPVRLGLVGLLTLIVAPGLSPSLQETESQSAQQAAYEDTADSARAVARPSASPARSVTGMVAVTVCEAGIGAALGLAVALFLSGIRLAGEWLDRHSGLGLGSLMNPEYSSTGSAPAEVVSLACVATILLLQPVSGHLLVIRCVLDTFHAIPVGTGNWPESLSHLTGNLVQQSLILGLRIAMPFVVAMSLLEMMLGWFRRSSRLDIDPVAQAIRVSAALLILAATLPGLQEAAASALQEFVKSTGDRLALTAP